MPFVSLQHGAAPQLCAAPAATMDAPSPPDLRGSWHALGESHSLRTLLFLLIDLPEQSLKLRDQPVHVALSPHTELLSLCHTKAYEYA